MYFFTDHPPAFRQTIALQSSTSSSPSTNFPRMSQVDWLRRRTNILAASSPARYAWPAADLMRGLPSATLTCRASRLGADDGLAGSMTPGNTSGLLKMPSYPTLSFIASEQKLGHSSCATLWRWGATEWPLWNQPRGTTMAPPTLRWTKRRTQLTLNTRVPIPAE